MSHIFHVSQLLTALISSTFCDDFASNCVQAYEHCNADFNFNSRTSIAMLQTNSLHVKFEFYHFCPFYQPKQPCICSCNNEPPVTTSASHPHTQGFCLILFARVAPSCAVPQIRTFENSCQFFQTKCLSCHPTASKC